MARVHGACVYGGRARGLTSNAASRSHSGDLSSPVAAERGGGDRGDEGEAASSVAAAAKLAASPVLAAAAPPSRQGLRLPVDCGDSPAVGSSHHSAPSDVPAEPKAVTVAAAANASSAAPYVVRPTLGRLLAGRSLGNLLTGPGAPQRLQPLLLRLLGGVGGIRGAPATPATDAYTCDGSR